MKLKVFTVSQVNEYISSIISTNPIFSTIRVSGEILNFKTTPYGYSFFSLKDENSKINAITYIKDFDVKDGDTVTVYGKINVYKKNGTYSILVNEYEKSGRGKEFEKFRLLYEELEKKGYFLQEMKKKIVKYPENIGVITSANGAALQDIISVIRRRYPKINLYIYDSKMQGEDVEISVCNGIEKLEKLDIDTILISRGGGDSDDLIIFNSKMISEKIHECEIPIISAIGHEIDFVICDFVADMRASTPSIAGELSVPRLDDVLSTIDILQNKISSAYKNILVNYKNRVSIYRYDIQSNAPYKKIIQKKLYTNNLQIEIENKYIARIQKSKNKLEKLTGILKENNYNKIMSKGFSIVEKDSILVKRVSEIKNGDIVKICMIDGSVQAVIKGD